MITINTDKETIFSLYGVSGAETMVIRSMSTNEVFSVPTSDSSDDSRYGVYTFLYDTKQPLNSGTLSEGVTNFNAIPGKYIYTAGSTKGILYINELKEQDKKYEQTNQTKTYVK